MLVQVMNAYEQRRDEEINPAVEHAESCVKLEAVANRALCLSCGAL